MGRSVPRGLYAITDSNLIAPDQMIEAVALAIQGGAMMIQYRNKGGDKSQREWEAQDLVNLCRPLGAPLIINDDVKLAPLVRAHGVHLGKEDADITEARAALGPNAIIGVSCYNELERAIAAEQAGADYVAFGSFFSSTTKPQAVQADISLLKEAKQRLKIPVVAIGGITAENGAQLIEAGADLLAVINDVFAQSDIRAAAERIARLFEKD